MHAKQIVDSTSGDQRYQTYESIVDALYCIVDAVAAKVKAGVISRGKLQRPPIHVATSTLPTNLFTSANDCLDWQLSKQIGFPY